MGSENSEGYDILFQAIEKCPEMAAIINNSTSSSTVRHDRFAGFPAPHTSHCNQKNDGICCVHLCKNVIKICKGDCSLFWSCAQAINKTQFLAAMGNLKVIHLAAYEFVKKCFVCTVIEFNFINPVKEVLFGT